MSEENRSRRGGVDQQCGSGTEVNTGYFDSRSRRHCSVPAPATNSQSREHQSAPSVQQIENLNDYPHEEEQRIPNFVSVRYRQIMYKSKAPHL